MSHLSISRLAQSLLIVLAVAVVTAAQDIRNPESAIDNRMRTDLRVDPISHALQFQIPLGQYSGRNGMALPITLYYSSKLWNIKYKDTLQCVDDPGSLYRAEYGRSSAAGWTSSLDGFSFPTGGVFLELYDGYTTRPKNSSTLLHKIARMFIVLPDGSRHELRKDDEFHEYDESITGLFYAVDGTRLVYDTTTGTLFMPDGSRYVATSTGQTYIDRNGNQMVYDYSSRQWTDTLGRVIGLPLPPAQGVGDPGSSEQDYVYSIPGVGGTTLNYTLKWRHLSTSGVINEQESDQVLRYKGDHTTNCQSGTDYSGLFHSTESDYNGILKQYVFNPVVLNQIVLPNGQAYTFKYNIYGEITKVIYPTGGYERFSYGQAPLLSAEDAVGIYSQANRGVTSAAISPDGTTASETFWTYSNFSTIAPDGTRTDRSVFTNPYEWSAYGFEDPRIGMVYDERVYAPGPNGPMLRRKLTDYAVEGGPPVLYGGYYAYKQRNPRPIKEVEILLDTGTSNALTQTTTYQYDGDLNPTVTSHYDFASVDQTTAQTGPITAMPLGARLRTEEVTFLVNDPNVDATTRAAYRARNLIALPTSTNVKDGTGTVGNIVAQSSITYDESGPFAQLNDYGYVVNWTDPGTIYRGNPTTTTQWLNFNGSTFSTFPAGTYLTTHAQYDQCGSVRKTWDARDTALTHPSQVSYADAFSDGAHNTYAFPTSMTTAVPDPNGTYGSNVAFTSTNVYDFNTGKVKSSTDPNGKTTSYDYSDSLNRLKLVTKSDTARVRYNYSDTPGDLYVQVLTDQDASRSIESRKYFDGLGRPIRGFLYDATASTPWIVTDTYYDILGRVSKASNPYRVSTPSSAVPATCSACTTTGYDVLGRVISVMTPDNALVTTAYGASLSTILGTTVTVTDQAGKLRRSLTNALGRLVRVDEPDTNGILGDVSSPNQPTSYFYDAMGNLRTVTQGSQQRFFAYDSLSRLLRARNPELTVNVNLPALTDPVTSNSQWSIAYTYDNNGNLLTKTDPRGVVSTYVYDVLNRNTNITYSNDPAGTPAVSRFYDGFRAGQNNNVLNSKGQLWQTETAGASGSRTITDNFDSLGRPLSQGQQFFSNNAWSSSYTVQRTYDLAGHVASETYPSNRFVNYNFDAAGRLGDKDAQNLAFKGNLGGEARTYASEVLYSPFGGMAKERLGTDTALYNKQFYNVRGQLAEIRVGTYSTDETWWNRGAILNVYSGLASWTESREDNNGNLRKQMLFIPNNDQITGYVDSTFFYDYDSLNRLDVAREVLGGQNNWVQDYDYDRYGNRTINQNNTSGPTTGPPINKKDFTVNTANNQLGVPVNQSGTMTYDYAGNLTTDTYSGVTAAVLRAYDAENRMTKETQANSYVAGEYTYNANGQRVRRKVNGGETWQVYGFDGELLAEYAANASYLTPQKEYGYRNGQLLITAAAGSAGWGAPPSFTPPATLVTGLDIKLEHLTELRTAVNDLRAHAGLSPYSFTVDPNPERYVTSIKADHIRQLRTALEQARSQLGLSTSYAHPTLTENSSWIYATDFQELRDQILTAWNSGTGGVEINWLVADQLGTPRLIFDKTGSLANTKRHDYLPFGEELVAGQGARTTALGYAADTVRQKFTSKERDTETGLDYFGARHYASTQGRFVITDPLTASGKPVEPQSWNRYQYCLNNPLMYTDPTGLIWGIYSQNGHRYAEWFVDKEAMLNSGHDDITEATTFVFDQGNGTEIRLNPNGPQGGAGFVVASSGGPFPSLAGFFWNASNYDYISKGWQVYSTGKGASGRWTGAVADDPVGNAAIGACFGGLGSLMRPGSGALNGTAAAAVEDYAASLRSSGQPLPTISSAAVDSSGSTFFGVSGKPFPELIHPELAARVPATSLEPWHPANCAEFKAVNNALLGGSKLNSLEIHTIRTANGEIMPRCANCRITTAGAKVTSDP